MCRLFPATAHSSTGVQQIYVFDHIRIMMTVPQPNEDLVKQNHLLVTNPQNHPEHIE